MRAKNLTSISLTTNDRVSGISTRVYGLIVRSSHFQHTQSKNLLYSSSLQKPQYDEWFCSLVEILRKEKERVDLQRSFILSVLGFLAISSSMICHVIFTRNEWAGLNSYLSRRESFEKDRNSHPRRRSWRYQAMDVSSCKIWKRTTTGGRWLRYETTASIPPQQHQIRGILSTSVKSFIFNPVKLSSHHHLILCAPRFALQLHRTSHSRDPWAPSSEALGLLQ